MAKDLGLPHSTCLRMVSTPHAPVQSCTVALCPYLCAALTVCALQFANMRRVLKEVPEPPHACCKLSPPVSTLQAQADEHASIFVLLEEKYQLPRTMAHAYTQVRPSHNQRRALVTALCAGGVCVSPRPAAVSGKAQAPEPPGQHTDPSRGAPS